MPAKRYGFAMAVLGSRFNKVFAASAVSNIGDGVLGAAVPLIVASLTRDPASVAIATAARTAPWFLFALISGALVDRMDRRKVMINTDLVRALLIGGLGITVVTGTASLMLIYVVAFALGVAETFFDTSAEAIVPGVVADEHLTAANGRIQAAEWVGGAFLGPPLGSFLFAAVAFLPFFFNAGSFVIAAVLLVSVSGDFRVERSSGTIREDIGEGVRWLWANSVLRTISLMAGTINLFASGVTAVFVLYAQDILGVSDGGYGVLLSALGIGGLLGAVVAPKVVDAIGPGRTIKATVLANAILIGLFVVVSNPWIAGLIMTGFGFSITASNIVSVTLRQSLTPDDLRGRVASAARTLAWGAQPIGAIAGGIIARNYGLTAPYLIASVAWLLLFLAIQPLVNNRTIAQARANAGV